MDINLWSRDSATVDSFPPGALPPLASVTAVRVVNFSTYNAAKHAISDSIQRITGVSPLDEYNKPGSTPTASGLLTFTTAGLIAGLVTSPLACKFDQDHYVAKRRSELTA